MPVIAIILIGLIVIAVIAKVSTVDFYYRLLKGKNDAKERVAFQSVFGGFISLNIQRYLLVNELQPFPSDYNIFLKYNQRIQRLNRFISFCLFLLMFYAGFKILISELNEEV